MVYMCGCVCVCVRVRVRECVCVDACKGSEIASAYHPIHRNEADSRVGPRLQLPTRVEVGPSWSRSKGTRDWPDEDNRPSTSTVEEESW